MRGIVLLTVSLGVTLAFGGCRTAVPQASAPPAPTRPSPNYLVEASEGYFFGAWRDGAWVDSDALHDASTPAGGETYRLYTATTCLGTGVGGKVTDPEGGSPRVAVDLPAGTRDEPFIVGVRGDWNAQPRVPQPLGLTAPAYVQAAQAILAENGLRKARATLTRVWRVDLEGDGQDEVLFAASSYPIRGDMPMEGAPGNYSFVALRKVTDGKVRTILLQSEFLQRTATRYDGGGPSRFDIEAVLDLNGDGTLEVVTESRGWGWRYHTIHQVTGTVVADVLGAGWDV